MLDLSLATKWFPRTEKPIVLHCYPDYPQIDRTDSADWLKPPQQLSQNNADEGSHVITSRDCTERKQQQT